MLYQIQSFSAGSKLLVQTACSAMIFSCGKAELSDSQGAARYITRLERASDRESVGNGLKRVLGRHPPNLGE